ncbi:unnamed protein product [Owenia fusiformis]|uniref:Uncharacterized protein n=1 Tax=Owenia fusiformis TaxID=6347 RepID=A0A8S4MU73_OWEFU|nr:unnamed protein product [Owenia fusiformis]
MKLLQIVLIIFTQLILLFHMSRAKWKNGTKPTTRAELMVQLLRKYEKGNAPRKGPTDVKLGIYINSFYSISEQTMDYSINIYLRQSWNDPRLQFEPFNGKDKHMIKMEDGTWDLIWTPDVFFRNEKKAEFHYVTIPNRLLRLTDNGDIWYASKITATLSCPMDLHKYPLDEQRCPMMFESFGHTMDTLVYKWLDTEPVAKEPGLQLPQFNLKKSLLHDCSQNYTTVGHTMETLVYKFLPTAVDYEALDISNFIYKGEALTDCSQNYSTGAYPCLQIDFILKRDIGYYMIQLYIPSVLIVILSWVAFWISIDAIPARVTIGLLTVLTMTTQSTGARSQLPRVSYIKAIDVWMSTCLLFVFASLLEFAVVNVFSRKEVKTRTAATLKRKRKEDEMALEQINIVTHNGRDFKEVREKITKTKYIRDPDGRHKARRIDKIARKAFPGVFVAFNLIYWVTYSFSE